MKKQDIQQHIRRQVHETVHEYVNDDRLNEVFLVLPLYGYIRKKIRDREQAKLVNQFIDTYDTGNTISNGIPNLSDRMKNASSLSDLMAIDKEADTHMARLNDMLGHVDEYVDSNYRSEKNYKDKLLFSNPEKTKIKLKRSLRQFIQTAHDDVKSQYDERYNELVY